MKRPQEIAVVMLATLCCSALISCTQVAKKSQAVENQKGVTRWGYSAADGPNKWGELAAEFALCHSGKNQSPVDISSSAPAPLKELVLDYQSVPLVVVNNGHTIEVEYAEGSSLTLDDKQFSLKQFHFHSPSETKIAGKSFPLEAHLVHSDTEGNLAVIAVLFAEGSGNVQLEKIWSAMPKQVNSPNVTGQQISAEDLLPADKSYFRYSGSLTTPPCTEGVRWLVLEATEAVSAAQVEQFGRQIGHDNNRPAQALNARLVLKGG